jgi:sulfur-oxidizing protein SoxB
VLPGDIITMERLLDQTCMTYPESYVRDMTGEEIKFILESVCDNLFNPDPYYQQGGDMVRLGGLRFSCAPRAEMGSRIGDLELNDGSPLRASKSYRVAGWATVGSQASGAPIWDVVAEYLRDRKTVKVGSLNQPLLRGVAGNPGIADY